MNWNEFNCYIYWWNFEKIKNLVGSTLLQLYWITGGKKKGAGGGDTFRTRDQEIREEKRGKKRGEDQKDIKKRWKEEGFFQYHIVVKEEEFWINERMIDWFVGKIDIVMKT